MFKYEGYIREKILEYKFNDKSYYYKSFVNILLNNKKICEILKSYDIIIPVPIHNKRRKERGYNQTELISRQLVNILNRNSLTYTNILEKKINTISQSKLNKEQREKNAKNVYNIKENQDKKELYQKKLLIFDDIYTTGSTVNECAKVLEELNPKKIGVLTIAKD